MSDEGYLDDIFDMDCKCGYPRGDCHCEPEDDEPDEQQPTA